MTDAGVVNIASHLVAMAQSRPYAPAVYCPAGRDRAGRMRYVHWTFQQLDAESDRMADWLRRNRVQRGTRTVLMVKPSLELFALTFALFKLGAVPVLIDPGMGIRNLGRCLDEAQPEAFIGIARAQWARRVLGWGRKTLRFTLTVGRELKEHRVDLEGITHRPRTQAERLSRPLPPQGGGLGRGATAGVAAADGRPARAPTSLHDPLPRGGRATTARSAQRAVCPTPSQPASVSDPLESASELPGHVAPTRADEVAAILFTSGSTGPPKGAVYTHGIFAAQVEALRTLYGIEPGEIDLCTFPLFALFAPALGMTAVIPRMDATRPARVDPRNILEPIESFGITNLFGSPALLRRVGEYGAARGVILPTLRRVVSAGAPVPARVIEAFAWMLTGDAEIHTPYGATEALPVASIGSQTILAETRHATDEGAGVCTGRPVPGMRVAIIRISDDSIPTWTEHLEVADGEIGEIAVRGPVATREYYGRPEATRLAKIADPDGGFWHRMGDVGYCDSQGRIWFCGRKAHRVVTLDGTLFTIPCEAVFNTNPLVARTALVGVGPAGAMTPVLCVEMHGQLPEPRGLEGLRQELLALGQRYPHTRAIGTILFHRGPFPVDIRHNSKIFREKLAVWAAGKLR